MEWPARAKRGGASARIRRAIAPILSSRMWLATVTGPSRHSAGSTGAKIRGEETRPGTSRIGIVSSMCGTPEQFSVANPAWRETSLELQIKTAGLPVKYAEIPCESGTNGFDGAGLPDYVERS